MKNKVSIRPILEILFVLTLLTISILNYAGVIEAYEISMTMFFLYTGYEIAKMSKGEKK